MNHDPILDPWIQQRREIPTADLTSKVLKALHEESTPKLPLRPVTPIPRPLAAAGCLAAGIGKVILIYQAAF
ncbi:hypothetical protein HNR46_004143 [Haloferula luteola]|uniref:Uncharacterized protein n=1 Tax=Haloferula luteola TaxID=595692 RepID=A0A840VJB4_9BACT|nr:hypothetical protein [Haloferula luteola]MBB5353879.1 hypothetical protein [Haloferula luteola]